MRTVCLLPLPKNNLFMTMITIMVNVNLIHAFFLVLIPCTSVMRSDSFCRALFHVTFHPTPCRAFHVQAEEPHVPFHFLSYSSLMASVTSMFRILLEGA